MNYYPFHIGDYATHTAHLEPMEDLAYRRLLDLYYLREGPLPADLNEVARLIRMRNDLETVERVLNEFFKLFATGWIHERCDAELGRMIDRQTKAQASAQASVAARRAKAERPLNERSTTVELPTPTPTPTPTPISSSTKKSAPTRKPVDVSEEVWASFLTIRKAKKSPMTDVALLGIRREAVKAGIELEQALTICCERGWQGFKAEWIQNQAQPLQRFGNQADVARVTVPDNGAAEATRRLLEERERNTAPPPAEVRAKMAELLGHMKVKS